MNCQKLSANGIPLIVILTISWLANAEEEYQHIALNIHNEYRSEHYTYPLAQSDDLMIRAVLCAQYYAGLKRTDHSCPYKNGTGENLWASWEGTSSFEDLARSASDAWYSESEDYNFYSEDFQPEKQNFSQMVWQSSQEFGFGLARNGNWTAGCALYSPSGNVNGAFLENVFSAYVPVQPPRTTHDINLIIKTASLRNMFKTQNSKQNPPIDNKPPVGKKMPIDKKRPISKKIPIDKKRPKQKMSNGIKANQKLPKQ